MVSSEDCIPVSGHYRPSQLLTGLDVLMNAVAKLTFTLCTFEVLTIIEDERNYIVNFNGSIWIWI